MITKMLRVSCIKSGYGIIHRVVIPKKIIEQCVEVAEAVRRGMILLGVYDIEFVARVRRFTYMYRGEEREIYYATIPFRICRDYRIRCGEYINVRIYGYGETP